MRKALGIIIFGIIAVAFTTVIIVNTGKDEHKHDYGVPTYTWSSDYSTCTARAVCKGDKSHVLEKTVTASWIANTDTAYTVNYYKQNVENDDYSLVEHEDLTGTTAMTVRLQSGTLFLRERIGDWAYLLRA